MTNTLPIQIVLQCGNCLSKKIVLKWFPDDHWKELAEIEQLQCTNCGNMMTTIFYNRSEVKLVKKLNDILLEIGDFKVKLLTLSSDGKTIQLHGGEVSRLPFFGDLFISGDYNTTIEKFTFSRDGIMVVE